MKILICSPEYPPLYSSGIGNVVYYIKKELESDGITCDVCSTLGSNIELCGGHYIRKFANMRAIYVTYYWYLAGKYVNANGYKYDLIWAHDPMPFFLKWFPEKIPLLITFHTILSNYLQFSKYPKILLQFINKLERDTLSLYNKKFSIVAVSRKVEDEILELGASQSHVHFIPNGVDINEFKPTINKTAMREKLGLPVDDIIILSLGKIKEQKQPLKLIELFSEIEKKVDKATLVIIGKGHILEEMKSYSKKLDINNIIFLGYVDSTWEYYTCSDYYIMTSSYEGLPLTLLEAMASGLPAIVSNIPNLEFVTNKDCGITIDPDNIPDSVSKIVNLFDNRDYEEISMNAKSFCQEYDWSRIAKLYQAEFHNLIKER